MATTYEIPQPIELRRVEQVKLPMLTAQSKIFELFPIETVEEEFLRWIQQDNFTGLQQPRGIGGKPPRVNLVGDKTYLADPGYYGEFINIDEVQLTRRRQAAMLSGGPVKLSDLVGQAQDILLQRRLRRIEYILWTLLTTGTFSVSTADGTVMHTASYTQTTFSANVAWSTRATSTPMDDLNAMQLLFRGQSVRADSSAEFWVNRKWANHLRLNTNSADLGGKRMQGGATYNSIAETNRILLDNDLPQIVIVEDGYHRESDGAWQLYIPDNVGILVAKRTSGAPIGTYRQTLNMATLGGTSGPYTEVIVKDKEIPNSVEVHDGHNGGPTLFFPGAIIKASI